MCPTELGYEAALPSSLRLLPIETRLLPKGLSEWRATPERFCVWSPSGLALDADRERIVVGHATLDAHAVYTAAAFAVADRARRGVSLVRGDHEWIVVETFARESTLGHGYQADATMSAAVWTRALRRALSVWLGRRRGSYDDE
mgnify:CR=1 FL=1